MLSVLIPCYNYDVTELVTGIHSQLSEINQPFEILISDDGSNSNLNKINEKLNLLLNVCFEEKNKNSGLSTNRNQLIEKAKYDYILLIDADMLITNTKFVSNYFNCIYQKADVVYGGITYDDQLKDQKYYLRWLYGKKVESKTANQRKKNSYKSILSSNLLIKKNIAQQILFEKNLTSYGYEDTLFAYNLKQRNILVNHIENTLLHNDFTTGKAFIEKTKSAIVNLKYIIDTNLISKEFVTLGRIHNYINLLFLNKFFTKIYEVAGEKIEKQLLSNHPKLFLFKIYKLSYFCLIKQKSIQ